MKLCGADGCYSEHYAKGYCRLHYIRFRSTGDPSKKKTYRGKNIVWLESKISYADEDCLLWPFGRDRHGYGQISRKTAGEARAHRWMCRAARGEPPTPDALAIHSCGNGHLGCVNPRHLRWGTIRDNALDRDGHGTQTKGSQICTARLDENAVKEIRKAYADESISVDDMAKKYGVHRHAITNAVTGKSWGWLEPHTCVSITGASRMRRSHKFRGAQRP